MKTSALMLGCLLATASLAQSTSDRREVWVWKDADGVTHYSDNPAPGARKMVLVGSSPTSAPPSTPAPATRTTPNSANTPAAVEYSSLEIWSPTNGESFFGTDALVNVRMRSEPQLAPGDRLLTYLDGKLLPGENQYEHTLANVERGAHSLTSVILNSRGDEKIRSAPAVFHIKQQPADNPRNKGPAVRPPPPAQPRPGGP